MRSRSLPMALAIILLYSFSTAARAEDEKIQTRIAAYLAPFVEAGQISGSLLVVQGATVLYEGSFGMANYELGVPVATDTRFNIASISKPMTQIIASDLLEADILAADDPISKWLPDFPRGDAITVRMLLQHRSGIPHRVTTDADEARPMTTDEVVARAQEQELLFEPGSRSTYSSGGYTVLARVLEIASGVPYAGLLAGSVFEPAAMQQSHHPVAYELIPNRAPSYQFNGAGEITNSPLKHFSYLAGAGSVYSTPRDLVRMMQAIVNKGFGERTAALLLDEKGLAWNGRTEGYRAFADYHAGTDTYIAFASNILTGAGDLLRRDLPRLATGEAVDTPAVPRPQAISVDPEVLARYAGDYELRPGSVLTLSVDGGEVRMSGWVLIPTSERTFFSPQDYAEIEVVLTPDGKVERLDWTVAGNTYPMPRVSGSP